MLNDSFTLQIDSTSHICKFNKMSSLCFEHPGKEKKKEEKTVTLPNTFSPICLNL